MADTDLTVVLKARDEASDKIKSFGDNLSGLTPIGVAVGNMLADLGEKVVSFAESAIEETVKLGENLQFVRDNLDNLTGSTQKTTDMLGKMQDLIDKGLFKPTQIDEYTQKLLQMGIPQANIVDLMHSMGAAAVGSSESLDEASGKMDQMTQMFGYMEDKGGLTVSMLGRMSRSMGIPVIDAMAKSLGMTTDQFESLKSTTKVTAEMLEKAFTDMTTGSGKFSKSIDTDSNTMEARQQALKNAFDKLKLSILGISDSGEVIKGGFFDKVSQGLTLLINWINTSGPIITKWFDDWAKKLKVVGDWFDQHKTITEILKSVAIAIGIVAVAAVALGVAFNAVAVVAGTLAVVIAFLTSPIGLVIIAITAVIAVGVLLITHWKQVQDVAKTVFTAVGDFFTNLGKTITAICQQIINDIKNMVNSVIDSINGLINGVNNVSSKIGLGALKIPDIPHFDTGGYVPTTGMAILHAGEFVLSKAMLAGQQNIPTQVTNNTNYKQPVTIYATIASDMDLNLLGYRLAFALRNSR